MFEYFIPINDNVKIIVSRIDCSSTASPAVDFSGVFYGNVAEITENSTGTFCLVNVWSNCSIVDKNGNPLLGNSTQNSRIVKVRCSNNNKKIVVEKIFSYNGTVAEIIINLYPAHYVISN